MTNPVEALNENFVYNNMLARALVQLLPNKERFTTRLWLQKLSEIDEGPEELINRNEYMWFLLLALQNKKVTLPFTSEPPSGPLRPLKELLPQEVYEDVLMSSDQNLSWLEKVSTTTAAGKSRDSMANLDRWSGPPALFLQNQPLPKDGIICYMAAFSDHNY